eukprot:9500285-Pyramimonas_sp.AAC.1
MTRRGTSQGTRQATCPGTCQGDSPRNDVPGCAVLRRAELRCAMPRLSSIVLWIESSFASES